jgi:dolichyl-diphosphooligosaccharide--protein glycosyltransferase
LTFLFPAGIYYCFSKLTDHNIFIILYGITSVYFAGVMVRLMLVLAPVMCILGGIAISASLSSYMKYLEGSGTIFFNLITLATHFHLGIVSFGVKAFQT